MSNGMFKKKCVICGKEIYGYAINKRGDVPIATCESKICQSKYADKKRFINQK